jgi:CheY-like chemotaxis protein
MGGAITGSRVVRLEQDMCVSQGPILVVEDVPNILELVAVTLRFKGYQVVTASNGEDALERIAEQRPALVVTDILMPKLDGFALMYKLRTNPDTNSIPVIFLSATYVTPEDKEFALSLGAARFLEKPVDTEEFLLTIAEILTNGIDTATEPISQEKFYQGYLARLESKLHHKNSQIARTERLLKSLPEEQKPAFEALLEDARQLRRQIEVELNELFAILDEQKRLG